MELQAANEVIACLPHDRTLFHYYRDRYGIGLLRNYARSGHKQAPSIAELKQSPYAPLAQKPRIKGVLARLGSDRLEEWRLALLDFDPVQIPFVLTLGLWGTDNGSRWRRKQISRRGYNLVLQLNFSRSHDAQYSQLHVGRDIFSYRSHPVSDRRNTLAWARLDFDLKSGTALIEEIQSDWIRKVAWLEERLQRKLFSGAKTSDRTDVWGLQCPIATTLDYCSNLLAEYRQIWAEAMLWAAIAFLREEIGIGKIYYHTEQSGKLLKHLGGVLPPQSLYTDLPRKFCFTKTRSVPDFLANERGQSKIYRRHPELEFYEMRT